MSARRRSSTSLGRWGEDVAARHLTTLGYEIVARNWRCEAGEMDIVARDGKTWVFVEVRTRRGRRFGTPEESITSAKQARLIEVAGAYLAEHNLGDVGWRVDVVAIELGPGGLWRVDVIKNAVTDW
jgi:putative endonuclease